MAIQNTANDPDDSIRAYLDRGDELALYCPKCDRWGTADLEKLFLLGHGSCRVRGMRFLRWRCSGVTEGPFMRHRTPEG